jgi:hypothetical protein
MLATARQQTQILQSNYEQGTANVAGQTAQLKFNTKRLGDIRTLAAESANTDSFGRSKAKHSAQGAYS